MPYVCCLLSLRARLRLFAEPFSLDSEYKYIHLTNYCQQKYAPSFGSFEDGNTLTFAEFEAYLTDLRAANGIPGDKPILETIIMPQIKQIVCDTFRALQGRGGRYVCRNATASYFWAGRTPG